MRAALIVFATISTLAPVVGAEAPFVPPRVIPPDYVATIVWKTGDTRTVTHHGDWSRVTSDARGQHNDYFATNGFVKIAETESHFAFSREARPNELIDYEPRNTGERQTYLNEACTVWEIERPKQGAPIIARLNGLAVAKLSCVTDDGIELWQKRLYQDSATSLQATILETARIERRPVAAEDAAPPRRLALDWWEKNAPPAEPCDIPDHEVVMQQSGPNAPASVLIRRRSGQWQLSERDEDGRRHIEVSYRCNLSISTPQFRLTYDVDQSGRLVGLDMVTIAPLLASHSAAMLQPKEIGREEIVSDEKCRWFNLMPNMKDAGQTVCLTADHLILKDVRAGWGMGRREWTAVRINRRPMTLDEIKPPAESFDPQTWLR